LEIYNNDANDGHHYALPAGFTTPLAFENNRLGGIVVTNSPGITVGTLSGNGYFRSDWGDTARVITVKQSKASMFTGYVKANNNSNRAMTLQVTKANNVEDGVDTTLTLTDDTTAAGTKLSVAAGASVKVTGEWTQSVEVAGTISGTGNLGTLTLSDGATIDATASAVTVTGAVMFPETGAVTVKKDSLGNVLSYAGEKPNMDLFTTATTLENAMLGVKVNEGVVTLVLTQVSVPEVTLPEDATEDEIAKAQTEAEVAAQVVADALAASTDEETRTANVTAIENPGVASVIENAGVDLIPNEGGETETYTAKFTYNFGVSALDVVNVNDQLYVVIMAKLDEQNNHRFAEGVTVTVTDGNKNVAGAVSVTGMDGVTTTDAPTGNTRYFRFPLPTDLGTHSYRVRASK
jgi:hypothetical protein